MYIYIYVYVYMDCLRTNAECLLVGCLSFKLSGSGQYVVDRRAVTFHTEGSNSYSSLNGERVLNFKLNGEGWLDPSTVRLMFDVMHIDGDITKTLRPTGYYHGSGRRLRISVRGQIIEDIQDFKRVSQMLNIFETLKHVYMICVTVFGYFDDIHQFEEEGELPGIKAGS